MSFTHPSHFETLNDGQVNYLLSTREIDQHEDEEDEVKENFDIMTMMITIVFLSWMVS